MVDPSVDLKILDIQKSQKDLQEQQEHDQSN